jgi:hypothetical protein
MNLLFTIKRKKEKPVVSNPEIINMAPLKNIASYLGIKTFLYADKERIC